MEDKSHIDNLRVLLNNKGLNEKEQKTLVNALHKIMKYGGLFTVTYVNTILFYWDLPEIDDETLVAFMNVLVKEFNYTVDTHTVR